MASDTSNIVNGLNLPKITSLVAGNLIPIITTNGAVAIDYANLNFPATTPSGGLSLTDTLTATNITASGTVSAQGLIVGGIDYSQLSTNLQTISGNLFTLINTTSAVDQSSNVTTISANQLIDEVNISNLLTTTSTLTAGQQTIFSTISAFNRVYQQQILFSGYGTTPVSISFSGIPSSVTSVSLGSITFIPFNNASAASSVPMIVSATQYISVISGSLTVNVDANTTNSVIATLTLYY